jgi:hypothetical protein
MNITETFLTTIVLFQPYMKNPSTQSHKDLTNSFSGVYYVRNRHVWTNGQMDPSTKGRKLGRDRHTGPSCLLLTECLIKTRLKETQRGEQ